MTEKNADAIDGLLTKVLDTKIQRKAKSIIMTCIQFILTNFYLLVSSDEAALNQNENIGIALKVMIGISGAYAIGLAIFVLIHALLLGSHEYETDKDVEAAYEKTNLYPVIDHILEIPLAIKFRGKVWWLVLVIWAVFLAIAVAFVIIVRFQPDYDVDNSTSIAVAAAVMMLYQITGDFSEYWIYTRNDKKVNDNPDFNDNAGE